MPGTCCAVAICTNTWYDAKRKNMDISFHRFPKDPRLREVWMMSCRRADEWKADGSYICSEHFKEACFERDFQAEFMGQKRRRKLTKNAIPTENLSRKRKHAVPPEQVHVSIEDACYSQSDNDEPSDETEALKSEIARLNAALSEKDELIFRLKSRVKRLTEMILDE
ncbi:THAP domain-containing protein 7-like [Cimex lectularius]|uniref:THAP-type domain-containing protein n=1 Tax=Cimex lectularius TaxID=79782 RepID=A0A8I6S3S1_CIMLE|nr:THAP domain-containing protein 7-like [Cimex lectularius]